MTGPIPLVCDGCGRVVMSTRSGLCRECRYTPEKRERDQLYIECLKGIAEKIAQNQLLDRRTVLSKDEAVAVELIIQQQLSELDDINFSN